MYLKVLSAITLSILIISCAPTTSQSSLKPSIQIKDTLECTDDATLKDSSLDSQSLSIEQKISAAEYLCSEARYKEADSILRTVMSIVDSESEQDSSWLPTDEFFDDIVRIYTDLMPPEFMPDDVAMIQFKRQMLQSLDSMNCTAQDSILIGKLINRKDISFDVPIVWNDRVRKALHYYLRGKPGTIAHWLEKAAVYLPRMQKMFADSGLPKDLAYLPLIESGFNPLAYSRAHASGIWQFISSTGELYGLHHNFWLDERRDPIKSTESAIKYLKKLYGDYGNWHLALAAYNCGEGAVGRAIEKCGNSDYWQLPLPAETRNYVPCYLAALTIAKNPDLFNFTYNAVDTFAYDTVHVNDCISMKDIASGLNINPESFRKMNPQIIQWCTPPDMTDVALYVPQGTAQQFSDFYSQLPDDKKIKMYVYTTKKGDKIQSVARRFKISMETLREINHLPYKNRLSAGLQVIIPIPVNAQADQLAYVDTTSQVNDVVEKYVPKNELSRNSKASKIRYKVKKGDTISDIADLFDVSIDDIKEWNHLRHSRINCGQVLTIYQSSRIRSTERSTVSPQKYTVQDGDTPYSISKKFGMSVDELVDANDLDKTNPVIKIGQNLKIQKNSKDSKDSDTEESDTKSSRKNRVLKYVVSPGDNLFRISQNFSIPLEELLSFNDLTKKSRIHVGDTLKIPNTATIRSGKDRDVTSNVVYYKVKEGDTLWNIAAAFGITVQKLSKINNLKSDSILMPGDTIKVIKAGGL